MNKDCQNIKLVIDNDYWIEKKSGDSYRIWDIEFVEYPVVIGFEPMFVPYPIDYRERLSIDKFLERFEPDTRKGI